MALYIEGKTDAHLHTLKDTIFDKGRFAAVEETLTEAARKRKESNVHINDDDRTVGEDDGEEDGDTGMSLSEAEDPADQADE